MIKEIRNVERAKGKVTYSLSESKEKSRKFARSLFVVKDAKKGECISDENIRSIRPSGGLKPKEYKDVIGRHFKKDVFRGEPLNREMIE